MAELLQLIRATCATAVAMLARLVTGVRGEWRCAPDPRRRIYFANHRSHLDFILIWTVLPAGLRLITRPVAGADY
jgi:1-acyl-sn-glycerol-3-phosphate acyltransferase